MNQTMNAKKKKRRNAEPLTHTNKREKVSEG